MLTNLPDWIKSSLLNWADLGKTTAKLVNERTEWERKFDEAIDNPSRQDEIKAIGRTGIPSELRHKVKRAIMYYIIIHFSH